jgi:hypothetical protein
VGRHHKKIGAKKTKKINISPSVMFVALGEGYLFPECLVPGTRGRASSPSALSLALGETFLYFCFFLPQFFCEAFKHYLKLLGQTWITFEFFCYISLVFLFS